MTVVVYVPYTVFNVHDVCRYHGYVLHALMILKTSSMYEYHENDNIYLISSDDSGCSIIVSNTGLQSTGLQSTGLQSTGSQSTGSQSSGLPFLSINPPLKSTAN